MPLDELEDDGDAKLADEVQSGLVSNQNSKELVRVKIVRCF